MAGGQSRCSSVTPFAGVPRPKVPLHLVDSFGRGRYCQLDAAFQFSQELRALVFTPPHKGDECVSRETLVLKLEKLHDRGKEFTVPLRIGTVGFGCLGHSCTLSQSGPRPVMQGPFHRLGELQTATTD